ncbi:MAG: hypothetical protein KDD42_01280, partial [Bdellovibrionales bacterium]|nr:hypothetical protein [Bdellovibrionales bacterium]
MKSQLLLIIAVLMTFLCAGEASALRLKVSEQNIQFFLQYESDRRYVCYRNTIEQVGPILGQIKDITLTPGARVKVIKDKRLSRSISKLERKIGGLSKKISKIKSLNPAPARLAKKLLRFEERLKKFSDQHSLLTGIFSWCLGANGEGGTPTPLPTITPTPTLDGSDPTPTPTPTITQPPGELEDFAGDPQSLAPYRDQLTEFEMRSVMNKLAFGGSERVIAAGLAGGRAAFVEALINDNPDLAEQNIPSEIPKPNSFYQIGDAEYWIYDHMQRGNGLQQFIALQLRDIFSVNLINNNNSESHNKAIPWYTMLYHDNALNFALQHEEAPSASKPCFNTGLPGSFEHLLCMQNWDLGMLRF